MSGIICCRAPELIRVEAAFGDVGKRLAYQVPLLQQLTKNLAGRPG